MVKISGPSGRLVELVPVDFEASEPWSEVKLADGSVLKAKIVFTGIARMDGERDSVGNPIYTIHQQVVFKLVTAGKGLRGDPTIGTGTAPPPGKADEGQAAYR